ncbi:hypothetical protein QFZ96_003775 [Paraburkholderia youngii]
MMSRFWNTASAVPRYQCAPSTRCCAGPQIDELAHLAAQEAPAALQMPQQRMRLVLRDHRDAADAGIQAIGKRKVDDPVFAAEVHRRFHTLVRQRPEPGAASAGEDDR